MTFDQHRASRPLPPQGQAKSQRGNPRFVRTLGAALTVAALSGCAAIEAIEGSEKSVDQTQAVARSHMQALQNNKGLAGARGPLKQMDSIWVDKTPVSLGTKSLGAQATPLDCLLTFSPKAPITLSEFSRVVMSLCNVSIQVTSDATQALAGMVSSSTGGAVGGGAVSSAPLPSPALPGMGPAAGGMPPPMSAGSSVFHTGASDTISGISWVNRPLSGLLDLVAARLGLGWKYEKGAVIIYYIDTRVYQLYSIPGKTSMETTVKSGGSSGKGGSGENAGSFSADGSSQETEISFETDIVRDIEKALKTMVTPSLGRMSISPSTGTVTVTDRPNVLEQVKAFLDAENKRITRQVLLNVKVISVQTSDDHNLGINWNVVYDNMKDLTMAAGGLSAAAGVANSMLGSARIVSGDVTAEVMINALSTQGKVSTLSSPSVTTLNLKPAPVLVGRQRTYLASIESDSSGGANGSTSQSMTPGTITTGFNMTLLPYLMEGSEMLLQYSINLSDLTGMRTIENGSGDRIEMPEVDNRIFNQSVRLRSGETLILSGFDQSSTMNGRDGRGSAKFWGLGGGGTSAQKQDTILVLITPVILD